MCFCIYFLFLLPATLLQMFFGEGVNMCVIFSYINTGEVNSLREKIQIQRKGKGCECVYSWALALLVKLYELRTIYLLRSMPREKGLERTLQKIGAIVCI